MRRTITLTRTAIRLAPRSSNANPASTTPTELSSWRSLASRPRSATAGITRSSHRTSRMTFSPRRQSARCAPVRRHGAGSWPRRTRPSRTMRRGRCRDRPMGAARSCGGRFLLPRVGLLEELLQRSRGGRQVGRVLGGIARFRAGVAQLKFSRYDGQPVRGECQRPR